MKFSVYINVCLFSLLAGMPALGNAQDVKDRNCQNLERLIARAVPREVGSEELGKRLLNPRPGKLDTAAVFNPAAVARVFDDKVEEQAKPCSGEQSKDHQGDKEYCNAKGTSLKVDASRGRLTYLNPGRSFAFSESPENKLEKDQAIAIGRDFLVELGLPGEELSRQVDARVLIATGRDQKHREKADKRRAEVHVLYAREVSGFPVFDSAAKLAFNARGQVARTHLVWPAFNLVDNLTLKEQYPREAMLRSVKQKLTGDGGCYSVSRLNAFVAYADSSEVVFGEGEDEDKEQARSAVNYLPALVVYAVPPEPEEDSGEIGMAGMQFTLPLFSTRSSGDAGKGLGLKLRKVRKLRRSTIEQP